MTDQSAPKSGAPSSSTAGRASVPQSRSLARGIRALLGDVRHLPDRLTHARRRAEVRAHLAGRHLDSALFICHGNICRSPYAAALFERDIRSRQRARVAIASAGFIGPGRQSPQLALATAARNGIDMSAHRSALITQASLDATDLAVVMDPAQEHALRTRFRISKSKILVLGDLDPQPIRRRTIRDPWGCDESVYEASYARIERCIRELVTILTSAK